MKGGTTGFMPGSIVPYKSYGICESHPGSGTTTPESCALHISQQQASAQNANNNKYAGGGSLYPGPYPGPYAGQAVVPQLETGVPTIGPNGPLLQAVNGNRTHSQGLENAKYDYLVLPSSETGTAYVFDQTKSFATGGKRKRRRTRRRRRTRHVRRRVRKSKRSRKSRQSKKQYRRSTRKRQVRRTYRKKK